MTEEIIDIIEEILQDPFVYFSQDSSYESVQIRANAIQELLKKYKQQQKEIEELKDKNKTLENLLQGNLYEMYLYYKELAGEYQANSISKDKIREKIKNLEENIDNLYNSSSLETAYCQAELDHLREKKDTLQELLEE